MFSSKQSTPIKVSLNNISDKHFDINISPLAPGYGHTFGNSIRRILLSSIPGFAVTRIRVNELTHEYQTIAGVVEDAMDVVINLKQITASIDSDEDRFVVSFSTDKGGEIYAKDIVSKSNIKITNPELYICTVNKGTNFNVELEFNRGIGYLAQEEIDLVKNTNPHDIYVDAVFSPILNVSVKVDSARVGDKTNYDNLTIEVDTDGTVKAETATEFVLDTLIDISTRIKSAFQASLGVQSSDFQVTTPETVKTKENLGESEDDIKLPAKIKNILSKNGVFTNADLKARIDEVESFAGIAEASLLKIKSYVDTL